MQEWAWWIGDKRLTVGVRVLQRQGDCGLVLVPGGGEAGGLLQDGGQRGRGGGPHGQLAAAGGVVAGGRGGGRGRGRGGGGGREGLGLKCRVGHPHAAALCKPSKWLS